MNKTLKKLAHIFILLLIILSTVLCTYAHSGRTDGKGGHRDSSTGEYHYHHGYPAHEHIDGKCPYDYDDKTEDNSKTSSKKNKNSEIGGYIIAGVICVGFLVLLFIPNVNAIIGNIFLYLLIFPIWLPSWIFSKIKEWHNKSKQNHPTAEKGLSTKNKLKKDNFISEYLDLPIKKLLAYFSSDVTIPIKSPVLKSNGYCQFDILLYIAFIIWNDRYTDFYNYYCSFNHKDSHTFLRFKKILSDFADSRWKIPSQTADKIIVNRFFLYRSFYSNKLFGNQKSLHEAFQQIITYDISHSDELPCFSRIDLLGGLQYKYIDYDELDKIVKSIFHNNIY